MASDLFTLAPPSFPLPVWFLAFAMSSPSGGGSSCRVSHPEDIGLLSTVASILIAPPMLEVYLRPVNLLASAVGSSRGPKGITAEVQTLPLGILNVNRALE